VVEYRFGGSGLGFSIHIFLWLGLQPTLTILFVLGAGYIMHNLRRIAAAQDEAMSSFRINHLLGDIVGLWLGGLLLLRF